MTSLIYPTQSVSLSPNIIDTASSSITHLHQRSPSNPFEVIYDSQPVHKQSNIQWHNSQNYKEISQNIHQRTPSSGLPIRSATSSSPSPPPILTALDDPLFTRTTGSIISRSATLRNRNRIKRRNKTVKKTDIKQNKPLKFPIRRKRSLQYKKKPQVALFDNKKQMTNFLMNSNYQALVKNFIPQTMRLYQHHRILQPKPALTYSTKLFEVDDLNNFVIVPTDKTPKRASYLKGATLTAPVSNVSAGVSGGNTLVDLIYQKYKEVIYTGGFSIPPPKFEELYPQDAKLLSNRELSNLNTKILFDILIRKTVAAKMGYRLKHNGDHLMGQHLTSSSSSFSSSAPSFSTQDSGNLSPRTTTSARSRALLALSSYTSSHSTNVSETKPLFSDLAVSRNQNPPRDLRNEFINDFNKIYDQRYKHNTNNEPSFENDLFASTVYQLNPINRSKSTLPSNDNENNGGVGFGNKNDTTSSSTSNSKFDDEQTTTQPASSSKRKSTSSYTSTTSGLQNLEDFPITSYTAKPLNSFDVWQSKNIVPKDIISPEQLIDSLNKSDQVGYIKRRSIVEQNVAPAVESMQASVLTHHDSVRTKWSASVGIGGGTSHHDEKSQASPRFSQVSRFGSYKYQGVI
ncbi:conserved hypothetical protein [Candida dubliniensis CD36]|uniref:Uncharacterized protein n=1 Tax=Candida dubliniensis (strain CD36 / ATCC MYA-646 / CBS 7987 / NCPF 3949 / NRRL Y-17841) TaxID=573826 RepID=B9WMN0_CANDC|nr:conserved hypothetical protein [Candida dubliniensis CD36]CAX40345.1 conserved hypothetical protein [Candida dubliniensis CD36]